MAGERVAAVTGGNRGIGLAICRGLAARGVGVLLTARDAGKGEAAAAALRKEDLPVRFHPLDASDEKSIEALAAFIEKEYGRLDILVNNAAIRNDWDHRALDVPVEVLRAAMETNALGPLLLCQRLAPLLRKSRAGRVVNVSSGMGSLAQMGGGSPAYRLSKVALNAITRQLADELKGSGVLVNACHPGWVRTEMGGEGASRTPEEGADTAVWLALLPEGGPTGGFFRDHQPMPW
ncbi:MAG: SDR family oxidoreductase [Candidatus Tectomicrobia bacterium]|uniref:SDR family oxidoreductase n=1 Tax=Tectimicrobiota bacterium TaxID=2528274 RepID=A0A932HY11_UNCTE|nr:SDR family oxidoreductase [Candidatus Tectomicrobia bacterium]